MDKEIKTASAPEQTNLSLVNRIPKYLIDTGVPVLQTHPVIVQTSIAASGAVRKLQALMEAESRTRTIEFE